MQKGGWKGRREEVKFKYIHVRQVVVHYARDCSCKDLVVNDWEDKHAEYEGADLIYVDKK